MKIRLTIMTENDKHVDPEKYTKEQVERTTAVLWEACLSSMADNYERVCVESCEVVEM